MKEQPGDQGHDYAGEQKINEYVDRIRNGESPESVMQGLSAVFRDAIEKKLYAQEQVKQSEENEQSFSKEEDTMIEEFKNIQDFESLKNAIFEFVPQKYQSFVDYPEILEDMWTHKYYVDEEITNKEKNNRDYALSLVRILAEKTKKDVRHANDKEKIKELRNNLIGENKNEHSKVEQDNITSINLENDILHGFENQKNGYKAVFWNNDKHQDALSIKDKTFVVADGAGSYEKSGVVSSLLSEKLAETASKTNSFEDFQKLFNKENFASYLEEIKSSETYQKFKPERKFKKEDEGLATFVVAKESSDGDFIEYASIGDSPLFVVDKNENGEVVGFQLVNDSFNGQKINQNNFYTPEMHNYLNNPETELIGIRKDGTIELDHLSKIKFGKIAKKEGRSVLLASDSIIKMMLNSPHSLSQLANSKENPVVKDAFNKKARDEKDAYEILWDKNDDLNFDFFSNNERLLETLSSWKENNFMFADDLTLVIISAEK